MTVLDKVVEEIISSESLRQESNVELIASENFTSKSVMAAQGSSLTNKYAEGYPGKRYYGGCEEVDKVEVLAQERIKSLFNCSFANVQPHSGSQANQAVFLALLKPGDTVLGLSLDSGGHLTHGAFPNMSGQWFNAVQYNVDPKTFLIDYNAIEELAVKHKPKMLIAGFSCYTGELDFARFREIADKVGAYLLSDVSHISGIIVAGEHASPFPHSHVVTSTTHKTLRGPRGGVVLTDDADISKKINKALFPGLQGGPLMHVIAGKAVAFGEALSSDFKSYIKNVLINAKALASSLQNRGYSVLTGSTTNHMVVLDLRQDGITGKIASESMDRAGITANKNAVPFDTTSPFITSGVRLGSAACTTRGFSEKEFTVVGNLIADILDGLKHDADNQLELENQVKQKVVALTKLFPIYS